MFRAPSPGYDAYIFDCDGTLADTMPAHFRSWGEALRSGGARFPWTWELFHSLGGMGGTETVRWLNRRFHASLDPHAIVEHKDRLFLDVLDSLTGHPPVVEFARARAAEGRPVAVASGGPRGTVLRTLRILGIAELFPVVVTMDDVVRGKPAPDLYLLAAARLGMDRGRCLVFEDTALGQAAAESAGMDCVLVESRPPAGLASLSA